MKNETFRVFRKNKTFYGHVETCLFFWLYFVYIFATLPIFFSSGESEEKDFDKISENPLEFNAKKRKALGDGIQESFLHPKPFKTEKMTLTNPKRMKEEKKPIKDIKMPKHKFDII